MFKYDFKLLGPSHRQVVSLVPEGSNVLEFGSATGYMTEFLKNQLNCKVTVVEIDEGALKLSMRYADEGHLINLDNLEELKQIKGKYDRILFADVLEHLRSPVEVMQECRKLLNKNGEIIISLPNIANWEIRRDLLKGRFDYTERGIMDKTHLKFYTEKTLREFINESGYEVDQLHHIYDVMPYSKLFNRKDIFSKKLDNIKHRLYRASQKKWPNLFAYQLVTMVKPAKNE